MQIIVHSAPVEQTELSEPEVHGKKKRVKSTHNCGLRKSGI